MVIEAMDFKVYSSLRLETYRPKKIIIEPQHGSIEEILSIYIYPLRTNHGYALMIRMFNFLLMPNPDILNEKENV
jgi:hypothetical protein